MTELRDRELPLERTEFTPPRRVGGERLVASPLGTGGCIPVPGPGRLPTDNREALMAEIVKAIASGETLLEALDRLAGEGFAQISPHTVFTWAERYPAFSESLDAARKVSAFLLLDEAKRDADAASNRETALPARVRADTKIKLAEKWAPERFGPRVQQGASVQVTINTTLPAPERSKGAFHIDAKPLSALDKPTRESA